MGRTRRWSCHNWEIGDTAAERGVLWGWGWGIEEFGKKADQCICIVTCTSNGRHGKCKKKLSKKKHNKGCLGIANEKEIFNFGDIYNIPMNYLNHLPSRISNSRPAEAKLLPRLICQPVLS